MTGHDDYSDDMVPVPLDDTLAEALVRGEPVAGDSQLADVSAFLADMRACASRPPPAPSPALAALLREGASPAPAPTLQEPARRRRSSLAGWRRRAVVTALGFGASVTGVVGAGAAGLLPPPAERVVAGVVRALTPLQLPVRPPAGGGSADRAPGPGAARDGSGTGVGGRGPGGGPGAEPAAPGRSGSSRATEDTRTTPAGGGAGTPAGPPPAGGTGRDPGPGAAPGVPAPGGTTPAIPGGGALPSTPTTPTVPTIPPTTLPGVTTTLPTSPSVTSPTSVPVLRR